MILLGAELDAEIALKWPHRKNTVANIPFSENGTAWKLITDNRSKFEVRNVTARSAIFQYATVNIRIFSLLLFLL